MNLISQSNKIGLNRLKSWLSKYDDLDSIYDFLESKGFRGKTSSSEAIVFLSGECKYVVKFHRGKMDISLEESYEDLVEPAIYFGKIQCKFVYLQKRRKIVSKIAKRIYCKICDTYEIDSCDHESSIMFSYRFTDYDSKTKFSEKLVAFWLKCLSEGFKDIHTGNICYSKKNGEYDFKIIDLGCFPNSASW